MRITLTPTRPRAHLLTCLLLVSMIGGAHADENSDGLIFTVGVIKLTAHPIPVTSELPGRVERHLFQVKVQGAETSPRRAKAIRANAHQQLARHARFGGRTSRQASIWHKPTRPWHWRKRRWKKQNQSHSPIHKGARSDQRIHQSEVAFGIDRQGGAGPIRADHHNLTRFPARSDMSGGTMDAFCYSCGEVSIEINNLAAEASFDGTPTTMDQSARSQDHCPLLPRQTTRTPRRAAQLCNG